MASSRIALFGGTFDPIHLGHTGVALEAMRHLGAEKLLFIPAKCSPLKGAGPVASDEDRLRMIELAISETPEFEVSDCELRRQAPSYTLETVRMFQAEYGEDAVIHWLLGADSIGDLVHWWKVEEMIDRCHVSVMYRAGYGRPDFTEYESLWGRQRVAKLERNVIETPLVPVSSTQIRDRLARGLDVSGMLDPAVAEYISRRGLYSQSDPCEPS